MKLVHLTSISFALCVLGLLVLVIVGIGGSQRLQSNQQAISHLLSLEARIDTFSSASDGLLLSGADQALWQAYLNDAQYIKAQLQELGSEHPDALKAIHRINIITSAVENEILRDPGDMELPDTARPWDKQGPLGLPARSHTIINQVANHGIALDTALDEVIQERLQIIRSAIIRIGIVLSVTSMLFAALAVFAFALIHRRIVTPMRELTNTIEAIRNGDMDKRAEVHRNDELGEMAGTLNRMLDHRQAQEEELVNHEKLLSESQRIASLGSWQQDLRTDRLEWSDETYRILGVTPEDFTPGVDSFAELVHPEDIENLKTRRAAALRNKQPHVMTFRIIRPGSGEVRNVHERAEAQYDKDGQALLFAGTLQDVTERKQLDARLIQYNKLVEGSANMCGICNSDYIFVYVNQAYCEYAGRERSDIEGRHLQEVMGKEYFEREAKQRVDRCLQGEVQHYETTREHARLGKRYLLANYFPIEASNNTYFVAAVITDITDLKKAESALEEQSRLLTIAGRMAQLGGWSVDNLASGRITWSDVVADIHGMPHGYSPTVEEGLSFYTPESREKIESLYNACVEEGKPYDEVLQIINANGEHLWIRTAGEPVYDSNGEVIRVQGAFQDITTRFKLEDQLRQSQRLEAVGQLTGGVAHDFNNLLTVITGNAEMLSEQLAGNPQQLSLVKMINTAAQRGAQLTGQLLAYARRQPLNPEAVDINRLLAGINKLMSGTLGEHIEVKINHESDNWLALVDAAQLENALLNLCINARDAMPQGGRLTIETRNTQLEQDYVEKYPGVQPGQYVQVTVSDTGEGIAREDLQHVFEPFFTTKEKGKGTGLGLAMVYGFVKQSNGHVNIYSETGQGTTVKIYLPRYSETELPPEENILPDADSMEGTGNILLVEDDELVRQHVHSQLMALGYEVLTAENGPEALEILAQHEEIDLLFTDIIMPGGMSGRDLAEEARKMRPELKVLYTSGYTENAIVHQGRLDPGVQLLTKPYRRAELAQAIRTALEQ